MRNEDEETGPNRTCVATRSVMPTERLIRFVLDASGVLTPDLRGKLPGRGAWVTASHQALQDAIKRKAFSRSLKIPVSIPDGFIERVESLLVAEVRQALAMANKAGLVTTGFAKVEAAVAKHNCLALVSASDGAADGKRKLLQAVMRNHGRLEAVPLVSPLSGDEMDLALGRENAIHAALQAGSASDAFLMKCQRLIDFRLGASDGIGLDGAEAIQNVDAGQDDLGRPTE